MKLMIRILSMPFPWNAWVMLLAVVNIAGAIFFFEQFEAKFAVIGMLGSMLVMQVVYAKFGFVRLLGLGHIVFWVPFVGWNIFRLAGGESMPPNFRIWLVVVSLFNTASLLIDLGDVVRYFKGERSEIV
jgi:hypothetical protein